MECKTVYFEKPGSDNTEEVLGIARQRAGELGIKTILIASTRGILAARAMDVFGGLKVIAVSHSTGFREPNVQEFTEANRKLVEGRGGIVLTATHVFAGVSRASRNKLNTVAIGDLVAEVLRLFGQGMKSSAKSA